VLMFCVSQADDTPRPRVHRQLSQDLLDRHRASLDID
jgi:hypothetical protein